jgi:O-antigen/teichoic acid export membrane protein
MEPLPDPLTAGPTMTVPPVLAQAGSPRSLRSNFSWSFAGNIASSGCQWGTLVLLARIATSETVGVYSLAMAVASPLAMISNLNLRALMVTDVYGVYKLSDILGLRYTAGALSLLIALCISVASRQNIESTGTIFLMTLSQTLDSISDTYYGILQREERMDSIAKSTIGKSIGSILALAISVACSSKLLYGVAVMVLVRAVLTFCYDAQQAKPRIQHGVAPSRMFRSLFDARWNLPNQMVILWKIAPLGLVSVLASLNGNIPRYFVENYCGHKVLGVFAALSALPTSGTMLISALGQTAIPRLARAFALCRLLEFKILLRRLLLIALLIGGCGVAGAALFGPWVLKMVYGAEYATYSSLLIWLMSAGTCIYASTMLGYGLTAASQFAAQVPVLCFVTLVSLTASAVLIPKYSVTGGAIVMILSGIAQVAVSGALFYRLARRRVQAGQQNETIYE